MGTPLPNPPPIDYGGFVLFWVFLLLLLLFFTLQLQELSAVGEDGVPDGAGMEVFPPPPILLCEPPIKHSLCSTV